MDFLPEADRGCHRTAFEKNCRDLVVSGRCKRWMQVPQEDRKTGQPVDVYNCADDWMPLLQYEVARRIHQLDASVESARNENVRNTGAMAGALLAVAEGRKKPRHGPEASRLDGVRELRRLNGGGDGT